MLKPFADRVIVRRVRERERIGRIIRPERYRVPPTEGVVVAKGPDVQIVEVGQRIIFARYVGLEFRREENVEEDGKISRRTDEYVILREEDVHAAFTEDVGEEQYFGEVAQDFK
ncbi:MAG: hypothetical protein ACE5LB_13430 [Acidiferrobacterales bacterium]